MDILTANLKEFQENPISVFEKIASETENMLSDDTISYDHMSNVLSEIQQVFLNLPEIV